MARWPLNVVFNCHNFTPKEQEKRSNEFGRAVGLYPKLVLFCPFGVHKFEYRVSFNAALFPQDCKHLARAVIKLRDTNYELVMLEPEMVNDQPVVTAVFR